ncbi:MAG: cell envelope integrity protein CreD [Kangiellaceae bacterium]|nr:cell envelope integrity protein CreD [Kangiellaceae bacterium]
MSPQPLSRFGNSITIKLVVIMLLLFLLQIPMIYVSSLIDERQNMQYQAANDIAQRWGGVQHIGAPLLDVNFTQQKMVKDKLVTYTYSNKVLPNDLQINVQLDAEKRYLGIYEFPVYVSDISMHGTIEIEPQSYFGQANDWAVKRLFIPIREMRGLKYIKSMKVNGVERKRAQHQGEYQGLQGFWVDLESLQQTSKITFDIELRLSGSQQLSVLPMAGQTAVMMESNWSSPSFNGQFLPEKRDISEQGFSAQWTVNELNHGLGRVLEHGKNYELTNMPQVGIEIYIPADVYQVNERSVKYGMLIMLLTFAGFFLAEMFFKRRLHPFQYLMIGFSLVVFYLLLLSLSEHLIFDWAFLLSALAVISMISGYCMVVLGSTKRGLFTGILFIVLYGFIYVLVKSEQLSLLMGALGIWLFLSAVMYLTRKIDWYEVNKNG